MHIISKKALRDFWLKDKTAEIPLDNWFKKVKKVEWDNLAQVQIDYRHADLVGRCVVFNIGGNKYRLITKIEFEKKLVFIKSVLTHTEYDKNNWKKLC